MKTRTEDHIIAWGFLTPALVVMVAFGLFPIGYAFFVSLHSWRIKKDAFVGFEYYGKALGEGHYLLWFLIGLFLLWGVSRLRSALLLIMLCLIAFRFSCMCPFYGFC